MCTASFDKEALNITIHNLYPDLTLTSPVYCSKNITRHVSPNQQADTNNIVKAIFWIVSMREDFKGALLYKMHRKHANRTNNYPNSGIEDTATNMYLLVAWDFENECDNFAVCLLECTDDFTWNEDKLWALRHQYNEQFLKYYGYLVSTWSVRGDAVIKTELDVTYGSDYKLNIIVSEGARMYVMKEPISVDSKRLVLPSSMLNVLMYVISLFVQPSIKLNIHNQCLDVDLASLVYVTSDGLECHRSPDYKVYAGDTMRSGFIIKSDDRSYGVLIYELQRKQSHKSTEIGEDTSSSVHLLVVWRISESKELYTDVLLVEHDKGSDKDNLSTLYDKNISLFRLCPASVIETWLLNDNTALMITSEIMDKGQLLNITISEIERYDCVRKPAHTDLKR
jgi:hypothetical protein